MELNLTLHLTLFVSFFFPEIKSSFSLSLHPLRSVRGSAPSAISRKIIIERTEEEEIVPKISLVLYRLGGKKGKERKEEERKKGV